MDFHTKIYTSSIQVINGNKTIKETFNDNKENQQKVHFVHSSHDNKKIIEISGNKTSGEYVMKITNKKKNIKKKYKINQKQCNQVMKKIKDKNKN